MGIIKIDPQTRLEGHLAIKAETVGGVITAAESSGTLFRGFEIILQGRDPRDATVLTQRICGVCPVSHGMASAKCLDNAFGITGADGEPALPDAGRIMRNLILGANFLMSHVLHFYHLAALDFVQGPQMPPWTDENGNYPFTADLILAGTPLAATLVGHYVQALDIRRKAQEMGAIFGGRLPCPPAFVPGGATETPTSSQITDFGSYLAEIQSFIQDIYLPDVLTVASAYPAYFGVGAGCKKYLAYGAFDLDAQGTQKALPRGTVVDVDGTPVLGSVDQELIAEYVMYSKYSSGSSLHPSVGETVPAADKAGAYSWLKAPRYNGEVYETGPLARVLVAYLNGVEPIKGDVDGVLATFGAGVPALYSVLGRHAARAIEAKYLAEKMQEWLTELSGKLDEPTCLDVATPAGVVTGIGLTEAPRGALGHWMEITDGQISRYQVITPTNWNASPKDDAGQSGPIEQSLIGTYVADEAEPVEAIRVVHSFDPCLACSVHLITPGCDVKKFEV